MSLNSLAAPDAVDKGGSVPAPTSPDSPRRRRSFTPARKLQLLAEYEAACETGDGAGFLRREGLYSSLMSEWRRLRDAGVLDGKNPGDTVGRPSKEQTEIARLTARLRRAEQKLATTETALEIMGKAHALLEQLSESADTDPKRPGR